MDLWISASSMTGKVTVNTELTILDSAMIWKMFRGQPVSNLVNWLKTLGDGLVQVVWLSDENGEVPITSRSEMRRFAHHAEKTE